MTRPFASICALTVRIRSDGTAKPMPTEPPCGERIAVFMPITLPSCVAITTRPSASAGLADTGPPDGKLRLYAMPGGAAPVVVEIGAQRRVGVAGANTLPPSFELWTTVQAPLDEWTELAQVQQDDLMLAGAMEITPMDVELLCYEATTYYGMVVAAYRPRS